MKNNGLKHITGYIAPEVADAFRTQTAERGYKIRRAVEGAIRVWLSMMPEAQMAFMANQSKPMVNSPEQKKARDKQLEESWGINRPEKAETNYGQV